MHRRFPGGTEGSPRSSPDGCGVENRPSEEPAVYTARNDLARTRRIIAVAAATLVGTVGLSAYTAAQLSGSQDSSASSGTSATTTATAVSAAGGTAHAYSSGS